MAQKLWEKSVQVNKDIERFTVGRDREMDLYLAKHDVLGSMAHITMLESIGLLTKEELEQLLAELKNIYASAEKGEFVIEDGVEDVHSQVELMLTRRLGDIGKKIHSGRSRNDQVLLDLKLFTVRAHETGSHRNMGWEIFTDAVIKKLSDERENLVFMLWGAYAKEKAALINSSRHLILTTVHPSPRSAEYGFFGCRHFSKANDFLRSRGIQEIDW